MSQGFNGKGWEEGKSQPRPVNNYHARGGRRQDARNFVHSYTKRVHGNIYFMVIRIEDKFID